jgi:hypothetical protein
LRRAEDVHGTIQVLTVVVSEKNSTIVEERVEQTRRS